MPKCIWCKEKLNWRHETGYVHQDGHAYKGTCSCPGQPHTYSHDQDGNLVCSTWRDHHVAVPDA